MASNRDMFKVSGPLHLTSVDWSKSSDRRCVAASLVQATYILETDRQQRREGAAALAPPWWEFFGFHIKQVLVDEEDKSIFGAIYEFQSSYSSYPIRNPPKHVIAFRGTLIRPQSGPQDLKLDNKIIRNRLHNAPRVHLGLQAVQDIVSKVGPDDVWLAGHSLGSSIALLVGRSMVLKTGHHLETYLFNPPYTSLLPILHIIKNENIKRGVRAFHSIFKTGMSIVMSSQDNQKIAEEAQAFALLVEWIPNLFINPCDPICCEYLDYFRHRERLVAAGVGDIGRIAAQTSMRSMFSRAWGRDSVPSHLIPSADLTKNLSPSTDIIQAHMLCQWWRPDLELDNKLYQFG